MKNPIKLILIIFVQCFVLSCSQDEMIAPSNEQMSTQYEMSPMNVDDAIAIAEDAFDFFYHDNQSRSPKILQH